LVNKKKTKEGGRGLKTRRGARWGWLKGTGHNKERVFPVEKAKKPSAPGKEDES